MSDGFFKRGKIWWFRTDPLTGKQASSGKRDIKSAELEYRERSRRATNPEYEPAQAEDTSLNHWAVKFVEHKRAFKSADTATFYEKKLGHIVRILGADTPISNALRPARFDAYVLQRKEEGTRSTTILKEIGAAKTMAKFAARAGAFHGRPELFRPTELSDDYEPGERFLTPSELVSLLAELPEHRAAHVALAVAIGCRFSETFRVTPADVDTGAWLVTIRGTKTKRSRATVPVAEPFRELLTAALPYLPLRPWLNSNMKRDLAKACAKAGIAPVTSNDLRRTHGSWLAEAGVSDEHIGKVLRHADGRMARRVYGQLSPEKLGRLLEAKTSTADRPESKEHESSDRGGATVAIGSEAGDDRLVRGAADSARDDRRAEGGAEVPRARAGHHQAGRSEALGRRSHGGGVGAPKTTATIPQQLTVSGEAIPDETAEDSDGSKEDDMGLKILVSAVQFRPGTPHNLAESEGNQGAETGDGVSPDDANSHHVRNEFATVAELELGHRLGWFGPLDPPGVAADFGFLQADCGGVVR